MGARGYRRLARYSADVSDSVDSSFSTSHAAQERLARLAALGTERRFRRNTVLIQEGDVGTTLYVVRSGRLRAFSSDARSGREITFGVYGPGEFVGEMSLDGQPRSASVVTLDAAVCSVIARPTLLQFIAAEPEFSIDLLVRVIGRARRATRDARNLALSDVYGRLTALLVEQSQPEGSQAPWPRHVAGLTQKEMAQRIGTSREMVGRLLSGLRSGGYLQNPAPRQWRLTRPFPPGW